jgi:dTDP-glucose pyrophosphorylase
VSTVSGEMIEGLATPTAPKRRWRDTLLPADATVQQAVICLNRTGLQIALVVTDDGLLVGTLTDGDIRRGLLRAFDLESSIDAILHREPLVVPPTLGREAVLQVMQVNKVRQVPIIDQNRRVLGLHVWDELMVPDPRTNLVVIMVGGRGTRLGSRTENCPKPMLPVSGKPMLEHIIEKAVAEGFQRFALAIHYLGHMIEDYFGDGHRWNAEISYVREATPLGTAGALSLLDPRPEAPLLVSNGDVLSDIRYGELVDFHERHRAAATMAVRSYELQNPFGVVHTDGVDIVGFEEKPVSRSHINAGMYVLEAGVLDMLSAGAECDMPTLFRSLQERDERTIVYPVHEPWLDVGQADDLRQAQLRYAQFPESGVPQT